MSYTLRGDANSLEDILRDIGILQELGRKALATAKRLIETDGLQDQKNTYEVFDILIAYSDMVRFAKSKGYGKASATLVWNHIGVPHLYNLRGPKDLQMELVPLGRFAALTQQEVLRLMCIARTSCDFLEDFLGQWNLPLGAAHVWAKDHAVQRTLKQTPA